jgi:hypothetical protein
MTDRNERRPGGADKTVRNIRRAPRRSSPKSRNEYEMLHRTHPLLG